MVPGYGVVPQRHLQDVQALQLEGQVLLDVVDKHGVEGLLACLAGVPVSP
jgi:hypothetical protein